MSAAAAAAAKVAPTTFYQSKSFATLCVALFGGWQGSAEYGANTVTWNEHYKKKLQAKAAALNAEEEAAKKANAPPVTPDSVPEMLPEALHPLYKSMNNMN